MRPIPPRPPAHRTTRRRSAPHERREHNVGLTLLAIVGCLGTYAADLLLLAAPLSGSEYFAVYQGTMVEASHTRLLWGNTLGVVFLPLQLFGLWAVHRALARAHLWLARVASLGLAFAVIAGLAYHVTFAFVGTGLQVHRQLGNEATAAMVARFREYNLTLFRLAQVSLTVGSLAFAALLLWKRTALPRWAALCSPLALLLMVRALAALLPAPVGGFVAPGYFNLTMLTFFAICLGTMKEQPAATRRAGAAGDAARQPSW